MDSPYHIVGHIMAASFAGLLSELDVATSTGTDANGATVVICDSEVLLPEIDVATTTSIAAKSPTGDICIGNLVTAGEAISSSEH